LSEITIFLINYSEAFIYAGLFLILFMCGLGLPIPEEVTLLAGGFLINLGFIRFYPTLMVVFIGILAGDLAMYSIGRKWGNGIITHRHLHQIFSEKRLARVRQFFCDHGIKTILIARFLSGFRVAAFLAAGTMGMKRGQFLLLDSLGALIMIPLLVSLGYYFGLNIDWLGKAFSGLDFLLLILAIVLVLAGTIFFLLRKKKYPKSPTNSCEKEDITS
jgi:membrane protein DedA with SNARE-associated domain